MKQLKRITAEEARYYVPVEQDDPFRWSKTVAFTRAPSTDPRLPAEEGWEDVRYYAKGILDPTLSVHRPEWVYVLVNKGVPGICKIGMTTTSVRQRVHEINSATGVITPWIAVYKYECINSLELEQAVHRELQGLGYRVNPRREGFEVPSEVAIKVIERLGEKLTVDPEDFRPTSEDSKPSEAPID